MLPVDLAALLSAAGRVRQALQAAQQRTSMRHGSPYVFRQLTRLNVAAEDPAAAQAAFSNTAVVNSYDILAVQPQSERVFQQACTSLAVDIISLDLSKRLPFRLKPFAIQAAVARGIHFEIAFAPALRDPGARRQLFANALALCRETRGRNIVVCSGARSLMELRGPYDVANLATLLGLTTQQAQAAVGRNAEAVLEHGQTRRAWRGVLQVQTQLSSPAGGSTAQAIEAAPAATPAPGAAAPAAGDAAKEPAAAAAGRKRSLPG